MEWPKELFFDSMAYMWTAQILFSIALDKRGYPHNIFFITMFQYEFYMAQRMQDLQTMIRLFGCVIWTSFAKTKFVIVCCNKSQF